MDSISPYDNFNVPALTIGEVYRLAPSAFATTPFSTTSPNYHFISTAEVVANLMFAGFEPVAAQQANSRGERSNYARHRVRFRSTLLPQRLHDVLPQLVLINSHDGSSAYQLRAGLYRTLCMNGLLARVGDFGVIHVPHRGNVVENIVEAALTLSKGFNAIHDVIDLMQASTLTEVQRVGFAEQAFHIRCRVLPVKPAFDPARLLQPRRMGDHGSDLWRVFNVVQENALRGGIEFVNARGRAMRTRGIRAIREDVRINSALWSLATRTLVAL